MSEQKKRAFEKVDEDEVVEGWRYAQACDLRTFAINMNNLERKATKCFIVKMFADNNDGKTPSDAKFIEVPTWYLESVANYSMLYSPSYISFAKLNEHEVVDVLIATGYTDNKGDFPITRSLSSLFKQRLQTPDQIKKLENAQNNMKRVLRIIEKDLEHYSTSIWKTKEAKAIDSNFASPVYEITKKEPAGISVIGLLKEMEEKPLPFTINIQNVDTGRLLFCDVQITALTDLHYRLTILAVKK